MGSTESEEGYELIACNDREELRIVSSSGEYVLPAQWSLDGDGDIKMRGKGESRALSHGGVEVGDYKADFRTLDLNFYLKADTRADYDDLKADAYRMFTLSDYQLFAGRNDRYYRVSRLDKIKQKWINGYKGRFAEITVSLRCIDPFQYSDVTSDREFILETDSGSEGVEIEIINDGSIDAPLIVSFTPLSIMPAISFTDQKNGAGFIIQDTMLTNENTMVVNSERGTVYRDSANAINTFSGTFLSVLPGSNKFLYKGSAGTIRVSFTPRWL